MSERIIAERHEFTTGRGHDVAIAFDPQCPDNPDVFGLCTEGDLRLEILRLRGDRDALGKALADLLYVMPSPAYSGTMPDLTAFTEAAEKALRAADLLPEEES